MIFLRSKSEMKLVNFKPINRPGSMLPLHFGHKFTGEESSLSILLFLPFFSRFVTYGATGSAARPKWRDYARLGTTLLTTFLLTILVSFHIPNRFCRSLLPFDFRNIDIRNSHQPMEVFDPGFSGIVHQYNGPEFALR